MAGFLNRSDHLETACPRLPFALNYGCAYRILSIFGARVAVADEGLSRLLWGWDLMPYQEQEAER